MERLLKLKPLVLPVLFLVVICTYFTTMQLYTVSHFVFHRVFIEQDPDLSAPYVESRIPTYMLVGLCAGLPKIVFILIMILYVQFESDNYKRKMFPVLIYLGLVISLLLTSSITNTLKIVYGSPRPSFFALCNYYGYRDAIDTNNYTFYFASTQIGRFGNISNCFDTTKINDAFMSFPSGHSSLIFASTVYTSMIIFMFRNKDNIIYTLCTIMSSFLFAISIWVSFTRVEEYKHRSLDVFAGMFLGCVIGYVIYLFIRDVLNRFKIIECVINFSIKTSKSKKNIIGYNSNPTVITPLNGDQLV
jgi:membrane-associated phospholipid phosphatase